MRIDDPALLVGAAALASGAFATEPVAATLGFALAACGLLLTKAVRASTVFVLAGVFLAGAARADAAVVRAGRLYEDARVVLSPPRACDLVVEVTSAPVVRRGEVGALVRPLSGACAGRELPRSARVQLSGLPVGAARGDTLEVRAELGLVQRYANEGSRDKLVRLAQTGAPASGRVKTAAPLSRGSGLAARIDHARARVRGRIEATYHAEARSLGRALVLGETDLESEVDDAFRTTGLSHLLAVSGTHLVLAVLALCAGLRALLVRVRFVAERGYAARLAAAVAVPLSWLYADFAGGGGSVLRAATMVSAAAVARALGRHPSPSRCFAASLLAGAAVDPLALLDASFALSAAATVGLMTLARPLAALLGAGRAGSDGGAPTPGVARRAWAVVAASMGTTLGATVACAPFLLLLSPALPAAGVVANVVAAPLGETFALPFALLHTLLWWSPTLEAGAAMVAAGALRSVLVVARVARDTGGVLPMPAPTALQLAALATALVWLLAARTRRGQLASALAGLVSVGALEARARAEGAPEGTLRVTVLDVGQGDAILVDLPDGAAMLVDGGGVPGSDFDVGSRVVSPLLRARRRARLDVMVVSHPHPDHYAGLLSVLKHHEVGELWDTGEAERGGAHGVMRELLETARSRGIPVLAPSSLCAAPRAFGGATVEVLAPCPGPDPALSTNDSSFVFKVTYGARSVLLTGDLEREGEAALLASAGASLRADVLKVGHHGSKTSSSGALLDAVRPEWAAISCGVRNRFGHPAAEVLSALEARGVLIHRTDLHGSWRWWTDGRDAWTR